MCSFIWAPMGSSSLIVGLNGVFKCFWLRFETVSGLGSKL